MPTNTVTYLVSDQRTGLAAVIDPVLDYEHPQHGGTFHRSRIVGMQDHLVGSDVFPLTHISQQITRPLTVFSVVDLPAPIGAKRFRAQSKELGTPAF